MLVGLLLTTSKSALDENDLGLSLKTVKNKRTHYITHIKFYHCIQWWYWCLCNIMLEMVY